MNADYNRYSAVFLRALGVMMALASWYPVVFPRTTVGWKGGNRAPLSMLSRVVFAVGTTMWTLTVFGVYPMYCGAVFALSIGVLFPISGRDRRAHGRLRGVAPIKPIPIAGRHLWLVFGAFDALILAASALALVRDFFSPPVTSEQHIVHVMGLGLFTISVIGALALLVNRSQNKNLN
jgi:hypothetical protein